jgi:hypothetical protein
MIDFDDLLASSKTGFVPHIYPMRLLFFPLHDGPVTVVGKECFVCMVPLINELELEDRS